ncbi:MAG: flagellar motor protein [Bdellovibrionales bacterium]|nr:flagellar motor protein [Bdellovibrionales bacterium]
MDIASILGVVIGLGAILGGNIMEGGHTESLMQLTAAIIVLGGTAGTVFISNTMKEIKGGLKYFGRVFFDKKHDIEHDLQEVLECAQIAKKESILALEKRLEKIGNGFFRDAIAAIIDGIDANNVREIFETRIQLEEDEINAGAKVWTDAGGFAPTIGIIGAVLGLIHVMNNLSDPSKLGPGIAVAFVATVYGVGAANLFFLPAGNKIKKKAHHHVIERMALLEGALMIGANINPKIIEQKLRAFTGTKAG